MAQPRLTPYEGPLEDLLRLVEGGEIDISTVSLAETLARHLAESQASQDTDALVEFVTLGARLVYLKSCALVVQPVPVRAALPPQVRFSEEPARPTYERPAPKERPVIEEAATLRQLEAQARRVYPRLSPAYFALPPGLEGVTLQSLFKTFQEALNRQPEQGDADPDARPKPITVEEKIAAIDADLGRRGLLNFREVMMACRSRDEVIASFLAVLELIKAGRCAAEQGALFGEILLVSVQEFEQAPVE